eukprot:gene46094-57475_t
MLKKLLISIALLFATAAFAAIDVNQASEAELNGIHGIGPGLSERILAERDKGEFKDWADLIERVKGIGEKTATKFSSGGMTVQGKRFNATAWARAQAKAKAKADGSSHGRRHTSQPATKPQRTAQALTQAAACGGPRDGKAGWGPPHLPRDEHRHVCRASCSIQQPIL